MKAGAIVGGVVTVPDLDAALADYRDLLGLSLVEDGTVGEALAQGWGCPGNAGSRIATLRPTSGSHCFVRLVEQPMMPGYRPTTTYGWNSFEITVEDVFAWPDRLAASGFEVVGPPREIPGLPYFVAMQVVGTGGEMIYLNESLADTPTSDMPKAKAPVDHLFIVILGTPDRSASVTWYRDRLGFDEGASYVIEYTMINRAFGLPAGTTSGLTMIQNGRMPIVEIDEYPPQASVRPCSDGKLPPGNALVTLAVADLDGCDCTWIVPPRVHDAPIYRGRRSATTVGVAGELVELVEIADA
ncbi:MAG: VOC family protein [Tsuneonella sp.]